MNILALTHPGTNSRGLFLDIVEGVRELGHNVVRLELQPLWSMLHKLGESIKPASEDLGMLLVNLVEANAIDLSMAMWAHGSRGLPIYRNDDGSQCSLLEHHQHPLLHLWWDAPHWHDDGRQLENIRNGLLRGDHQFHYINNPATGGEMAALMGFKNVIPSPNGVNPLRFRPLQNTKKEYDLVFVSGPGDPPPTKVMLQELESDDPDVDRIRRDVAVSLGRELDRLAGEFAGSIAEPMRRLFDEVIEVRLADRHSPAITHIKRAVGVDGDLATAADALIKDIGLYVRVTDTIRRIEKWERPFLVAYLSRHFKCLRLGQQSYDAWDIRGDAGGFVDYERQSECYARGRLALNVMRWQDDVGLNSKIFEITASGAACLEAYRSGLDELFVQGKEILVFRTPGEARQRLADALAVPGAAEEIAAAGRARTLKDHTWARRMEVVLDLVQRYWSHRGRALETASRAPPLTVAPPEGEQLAFILAPMRSGTTLLRKMLNAHPKLAAPPETWFLLPLANLWAGEGEAPGYNVRQAAAALKSVTDRETFLEACRRFASTVYAKLRPPGGVCVIDKTPMYLKIADQLPITFPRARFILLGRDPRATAWSFYTWEKVSSTIDAAIEVTGDYFRRQFTFARTHSDRSLVVHYERLCREPESVCGALCEFLGTAIDPAMIDYADHGDQRPGYGDEKSLVHRRPHTESLSRWQTDGGGQTMTIARQRRLAELCTVEALEFFGYRELAGLIAPSVAPA